MYGARGPAARASASTGRPDAHLGALLRTGRGRATSGARRPRRRALRRRLVRRRRALPRPGEGVRPGEGLRRHLDAGVARRRSLPPRLPLADRAGGLVARQRRVAAARSVGGGVPRLLPGARPAASTAP